VEGTLSGAGLCPACTSGRGSTFLLCRQSETDPEFAKYPRLPVLDCGGFHPRRPVTDQSQRVREER
jgi:hypothetical protein